MTGVISDLRSVVQIVNNFCNISAKRERLRDVLVRRSEDLKNWETNLSKYGFSDDQKSREKLDEAKSALSKVQVRHFGKNDNLLGRSLKDHFFDAKLKSSIEKVIRICDDLINSLTRANEIASPCRFRFSSDRNYVPLRDTEERVRNALEKSQGPPVVLLYGKPGTGKTALSRNLALRFQTEIEEAKNRASGNQQASMDGPVFDRVLYVDCGPEVTLAAKYEELAGQLDPSASKYLAAEVQDASGINDRIIKAVESLLKERRVLIILDDVYWSWEESFPRPGEEPFPGPFDVFRSGEESFPRPPGFLQEILKLSGKHLKWLITSRSSSICDHLRIRGYCEDRDGGSENSDGGSENSDGGSQKDDASRGFCCIPMEKVKEDDARRILATLTGLEESAIPEMQDEMNKIIMTTNANPLALACMACVVSTLSRKKKDKFRYTWEQLKRHISSAMWLEYNHRQKTQKEKKTDVHVRTRSFYGEALESGLGDVSASVGFAFRRLSTSQQNLLILIRMCEGPSVSSSVMEYLFNHTRRRSSSEAFCTASDELQARQLITVKTVIRPGFPCEKTLSIPDVLRAVIWEEIFEHLDGTVSVTQTLAKRKEGIMFEKRISTL